MGFVRLDCSNLKRIFRLTNKKGIRHIINNRNQAADHTWDRHCRNCLRNLQPGH